MFKGFYNLTSGMITQGKKLDVVSNNMTNIATTGFKSDQFVEQTFDTVMWSRTGNKEKSYTDIGEQSYVTAPSNVYTDFSQGTLEPTGGIFDFAIEGEGYFAIQTDNGRMYTRAGSFALNADNYLCLPGQGLVLDNSGNTMQFTSDRISADNYGNLTYNDTQRNAGKIGVFTFDENAVLLKNTQGHFETESQGQEANPKVYNGMIERSNVDLMQQMMSMISSQRSYQSVAQAMKIYDQILSKSSNDIGRL